MRTKLIAAAAFLICAGAYAQTNSYTVTNLVTNTSDPHLLNPWGLSRASSKNVGENQWWVSDQVSGLSTLYTANGTIVGLTVTIPPGTGTGTGSPTGTAANTVSTSHVVFAFATLDGRARRPCGADLRTAAGSCVAGAAKLVKAARQ